MGNHSHDLSRVEAAKQADDQDRGQPLVPIQCTITTAVTAAMSPLHFLAGVLDRRHQKDTGLHRSLGLLTRQFPGQACGL